MARKQRSDADLARVVERSRTRAAALGQLTPPAIGPIHPVFTDEARSIIAEWKRAGGYERALDEIADADPDLAVQ